MAATSTSYGACACGMRGDTSREHPKAAALRYRSTERYSYVDSLESHASHETHTWWCYRCRRSEGECLTSGRQSHGREEGDRCGYEDMLRRRAEMKEYVSKQQYDK